MTIKYAVVFATIVVFADCTPPSPEVPVNVRPVRVVEPQPLGCSGTPRFSGNVLPLARVDLAFKRGGYVAEVRRVGRRPGALIDEGDRVKRGAVLARLRDADYRVKLEQARAQLIQAMASENQSKQDLERANKMFAGSAMPRSTLDGAQNKSDAVSAQRRAAELLVQEAELALADCTLSAPLDAVVLKRMVEPGNLVGPGSPGFILANNSSMKVTFGVPDVMLDKVKVGTPLEVTVEAVSAVPFSGQVSRVAAAADPKSRLFEIEVLLPNANGRLRAGMIASLHVDAAVADAGLSVPLTAVVRPPGKTEGFAVFVAEDNVVKIRTIEPGEVCGSTIEVRSGLQRGDRVVAEGAAQSFDGEKVALVP
jgi:multidrug efflux system membrane fusion protein